MVYRSIENRKTIAWKINDMPMELREGWAEKRQEERHIRQTVEEALEQALIIIPMLSMGRHGIVPGQTHIHKSQCR
jgi:hypothetical protein